ncbi:MAG: bL28 family ribosomal protein, partial [Oligoflexia bacterium]|nr:bL28 family ribosomal protein [Oligoflexia bacterium]
MALCELSGKKTKVKNLVSHSNIKTKSKAFINIQSKRFFSLQLKKSFQFKVSTHAIRHIDKLGDFDVFI